jgi:succinate dehydrogenase/fumarate reductase flavoprotein subunit
MKPLLARCEQAGVRASFDSVGQSLITNGEGRICGVVVRQYGKTLCYSARKGVVIATAGFGRNEEMLATYFPDISASAEPMGIPQTDGSGINMAVSVGGDVMGMRGLIATASFYPPPQLIKGIVVNRLGQRFVAEDSYHGRTASFIMEQPDQRAFLIVDSENFAYPEILAAKHTLIDGYESIEEIERGLELPEGSLVKTLAFYNTQAAMGVDPLFYKHTDWLVPLTTGPWAAFDISFNRSTYYYITLGGLKISTHAEVLDAHGNPVRGLFAAGACTAHLSPCGKSYASGLSLGQGSFFGRVAGRSVLQVG